VIFLYFPDLDKAHRVSGINDLFTSFVNFCLSHISPMPNGLSYVSNLYANKLYKPKPPSTNVDEDRCSMVVVSVWFLYSLEFFSTSNLSALGVVFSC